MGLRTKFNVAILVAFVFGFCVTGVLLNDRFVDAARQQALASARVMLSGANSIRKYTTGEIEPLIGAQQNGKFLPASVPSFAAQTNFRGISVEFPAYSYKEAALNPTNPTDRATAWEADVINRFRQSPSLSELEIDRDTSIGRTLSLARPLSVTESACLECHSQPSAAPQAMLASYGEANGFGWNLHEIIGAQIISVLMDEPLKQARQALILFLAMLTGVFLLMLAILNGLLHFLVVRPVAQMSRIATEVSLGNLAADEFTLTGSDEVGLLAKAFNRMRQSLETALHMLDDYDKAAKE